MNPTYILSIIMLASLAAYWFYRTGELTGYEQGYDDGLRRGFQKGKDAAKAQDHFENYR